MEGKDGLLRLVSERLYHLGRYYQDKWRAPRPLLGSPAVFIFVAGTSRRGTQLPSGDAIFHVGNLSKTGSKEDIQAQINWLSQAEAYRDGPFCIGGERDLLLDPRVAQSQLNTAAPTVTTELNWQAARRLHDSSAHVSTGFGVSGRSFIVYGHPRTPGSGDGAFHYPRVSPEEHHTMMSGKQRFKRREATGAWYERLPHFPSSDIVLANTAPACHLDGGTGCPSLLYEIWRCKPQLLVCTGGSSDRRVSVLYFDSLQRRYEGVVLAKSAVFASLSLILLCWHVCVALVVSWLGMKEKRRYTHWYRGESTTVISLADRKEGDAGSGDACVVFFDPSTYDSTVKMDI